MSRNFKQSNTLFERDAARSLFANIVSMSVDKPMKVLTITSSVPKEGKTYVCVCLAEVIADSGKKVLVLEGNVRNRGLADALDAHPDNGLHAVINNQVPLEKVVMKTSQNNLFLLDAEPDNANPSDFLKGSQFAELLQTASNQFDYILIDTPPINAFSDAVIIAKSSDATFLVAREGFTKPESILIACNQLDLAGAYLAGVVMNYCSGKSNQYGNSSFCQYYSAEGAAHKRIEGDGASS